MSEGELSDFMDEKDIKILRTALVEKTNSAEEIADATGIPKSTVHYRIQNLKEAGIIKNDLYEVELDKLGLSLRVISEVQAVYEEDYHHEVGNKLAEIEGVNQVYFTMGDTDFIVIATLPSRDMIERLIYDYERIEEVQRTSSMFVITTVKDNKHVLTDFSEETLIDLITPTS